MKFFLNAIWKTWERKKSSLGCSSFLFLFFVPTTENSFGERLHQFAAGRAFQPLGSGRKCIYTRREWEEDGQRAVAFLLLPETRRKRRTVNFILPILGVLSCEFQSRDILFVRRRHQLFIEHSQSVPIVGEARDFWAIGKKRRGELEAPGDI